MKTIGTKKLNLDLQTVRTLTAELDTVVGGRGFGIVSTDTPSVCFACTTRNPVKLPKA